MNVKSTISSLALLKAMWDISRKDYVENFLPLIATLIKKDQGKYSKGFTEQEIVKDFETAYGLQIPYHPMHTVLGRASKRGLVRLERKLYYPIDKKVRELDISGQSLRLEQEEAKVISEFLTFCKYKFSKQLTEEEARIGLVSYLKDHDVDVVIGSTRYSVLPDVNQSQQFVFFFASFVKAIYESEPQLYQFLVDIAVGYIFATVLLNENLDNYQGRFRGKCIYLDTGLVLKALGFEGADNAAAYLDFLEMLKDQGAELKIFEHTLDEMSMVLEGCRAWVASRNFDPGKASPVSIYLHDSGYTDSDIQHLIATLSARCASFGLRVVPEPDPNTQWEYQISESALRDNINEEYGKSPYFDENLKALTIDRDIRSVSAIYKLRQGYRPRHLSDAKHTFVTTNGGLAKIIFDFDRKQNGGAFSIPVCLTDVFVGTIAWLHSPNAVEKLNYKKLVADCYAILQPSHALLARFADAVDKLRKDGLISADEELIVRSDHLSREILMEFTYGDPSAIDIELTEAVVAETRHRLTEKERVELEKQKQETQRRVVQLTELEARHRETIRSYAKFVWTVASATSWIIFFALLAVVLDMGYKEFIGGGTLGSKLFWGGVAIVTLVYGVDLGKVRKWVKRSIATFLANRLKLPSEVVQSTQ